MLKALKRLALKGSGFFNVDKQQASLIKTQTKDFIEPSTKALIADIEAKASKIIGDDIYAVEAKDLAYEAVNVNIPILVKSYEQICIAGEQDIILQRMGRYPVSMLNETLRIMSECMDDLLSGDYITYSRPAMYHSVENISQLEKMLQTRDHH